MKKIVMIMALFAATSTLPACRTTIDDDKVTVDTDRNGHDGHHCPPGHAKKGWC